MMFVNLCIFLHTMGVGLILPPYLTFRSTLNFPLFVRRCIILLLTLTARFDGRNSITNRNYNNQYATCPYESVFDALSGTQLFNGFKNPDRI